MISTKEGSMQQGTKKCARMKNIVGAVYYYCMVVLLLVCAWSVVVDTCTVVGVRVSDSSHAIHQCVKSPPVLFAVHTTSTS